MLTCSDYFDKDLNPKVQIELEKLNSASAQINDFENKLQELRKTFCETLSQCSSNLTEMSQKVGAAIPRTRPYFELKRLQIQVQRDSQNVASRYRTACIQLNHANCILNKNELMTKELSKLDDSGLEVLNIAINNVNLAKKEKYEAQIEYQNYLKTYNELGDKILIQERKHKNDIKKSMEYFNYSKQMDGKLKEEKINIEDYEEKIRICKAIYNESLQRLEDISNEIHEQRRHNDQLGPRGEGVGAECDVVSESTLVGPPHCVCDRPMSPPDSCEDKSSGSVSLSVTSPTHSNALSLRRPAPRPRQRPLLASSTPLVDGLLKAAADNFPSFLYCDSRALYRHTPVKPSSSSKKEQPYL